jgi:hypothetical protein
MPAKKNNSIDNKPDYSLIPKVALDQLAYCMMAGAQKYGRYNYARGHTTTQLIAAAQRHLASLLENEDHDTDVSDRAGVKVHHLACVMANCLMYLHQEELGTLTDDRFKGVSNETSSDKLQANREDKTITLQPWEGTGTTRYPG